VALPRPARPEFLPENGPAKVEAYTAATYQTPRRLPVAPGMAHRCHADEVANPMVLCGGNPAPAAIPLAPGGFNLCWPGCARAPAETGRSGPARGPARGGVAPYRTACARCLDTSWGDCCSHLALATVPGVRLVLSNRPAVAAGMEGGACFWACCGSGAPHAIVGSLKGR